jgi:hypothetical protein
MSDGGDQSEAVLGLGGIMPVLNHASETLRSETGPVSLMVAGDQSWDK